MQTNQLFIFGPYRLAPHTGQVWRGKQEVKLTGKAAAVLRYVLDRAGQVVTKEELFQAVWPETVVSDAALTSCIQELRQALRDNARKPRYIETVHRRGFRFIAEVQGPKSQGQRFSSAFYNSHSAINMVGREPDLVFLHERLAKAIHGARQVVFVTGEPGIGKTTVVEAFLRGMRNWELGSGSSPLPSRDPKSPILNPIPWLGRGQCVEHYGAGEAYLPVLEALGRLCREPEGEPLIALLRQHAPTWLVQMPALLSSTELEELQRKTAGVTRERMLREVAEAIEVLTQQQPLVLVLEDLHWSDVSTLDLLSVLARRQESARLLIIGTYRPVEVLTQEHPLKGIKQELQVHGQCEELALDFLSEPHVAEYLTVRFDLRPPHPGPLPRGEREPLPAQAVHNLAHVIHQRTDGNPLFMVNVTNELVAREVVIKRDGQWELRNKLADGGIGVPVNLRQLIEQQIGRVSPEERKVLEAASVAGAEFAAAAVAAGIEQSPEAVETHCDNLVRREQFLRTWGTTEWPDGTIAARYGFVHALYQEVLYERLSANRRVRLHKQIGEREEAGYGAQAGEIAAELAVHFERGRDYERAVQYRQQAGEKAMRRNANQEAIDHLTKGLEVLKMLPDTPERTRQELTLQLALGVPLQLLNGWGASSVVAVYNRARELCQQIGDTPHLFSTLFGLWRFYLQRAELQTVRELAERLLNLAQQQEDTFLLMEAHRVLAATLFFIPDFAAAKSHSEQAMALYNKEQGSTRAALFLNPPGVVCRLYVAHILWIWGYADQARQQCYEALSLARQLSHPASVVYTLAWTSWLHQFRREAKEAQGLAEEELGLLSEQGFAVWQGPAAIVQQWALAMQGHQEGVIAAIHEGLDAYRASGSENMRSYFLSLLAEAGAVSGQITEGQRAISEALTAVESSGIRYYEAELYRLKGELTLQAANQKAKGKRQKKFSVVGSQFSVPSPQHLAPNTQEAEACFLKAIDVARQQQAKSWELRATVSLARLWQQQGRQQEAYKLLSDIYNWFTEGFETKDLQEAKKLIEELSR
jgi:DNA-binding winged helix-turn-helix (wHTH) protein/predicted ATPase